MSISMDDSINMQIQPIVQKMVVVNSHQLLVRKPSNQAQDIVHSPPTASLTPQQPSEKLPEKDMKDLLLIDEEPSIKEQSIQITPEPKNKKKQIKDNVANAEIIIDEKPQNSYSDVHWSKLITSKTSITRPSFQFHFLQDKAAEFSIKVTSFEWLKPKLQNTYYYISSAVLSVYLSFFITLMLFDLEDGMYQQPIYQVILMVFWLIDTINQILFIQYKNGEEIILMEDLVARYCKFQSLIDILGIIPIIFCLISKRMPTIQLLHLVNIWKIRRVFYELQMLIELHFVQFIALTIIQFSLDKHLNFFDEFIVLFYKSENANALTYIVRLLILIYYCYFIHRYNSEDKWKLNQISIQNNTKQKINGYINKLKSQSTVDLNFLEYLPQSYVEDFKNQRYMQILSNIPIFKSSFSEKTLKEICNLIQEYTYNPNQTILLQQTPNQQLYFILSGDVRISQKREGTQANCEFKLKVLGEGQMFNNKAFFKNSFSNIAATSIGFSQIAQLDVELFQECIKNHHQEKQKYKMMLDQIVQQEFYSLCLMRCYACGKFHDIDECDHVHYVPKRSFLVSYIQSNDIQGRFPKKRIRCRQQRTKSFILKIEENALLYQQLNIESELSEEHRHLEEMISIQQQHYLKEVTNPYTERQNSLLQSQQTPHMVSQQSLRESIQSQQQPGHQLMDIPNISPVQYVQQPPSGISHSSYAQLLKDASVNRKNFNGSSDKNSSGNVFSLPYSSNGSKTNPNNVMQNKDKEELISIQLKKAKLKDSVYYHQRRIQNQIESEGPLTPSMYQKCQTTAPQQQQTKAFRSDRKSNSCISESEKGEYQVQQQQEKPTSKYGIASSKFTGETAKQFMRNPLEMPNIEFYQSFEKSNQYSDFFPQYNVDQAIESYKQYQQSRSSAHK
ncbi:unnamed protein product (macronuclear) [Paramecium tetraurelia]|uniref:Cyclic nucleotide-binding domain-containing protein n=1 Tax=Paramecium tetraurelia TaxID=5888 RepID=A0CF91_PARTE|nr:uncharacterized protein GSPATT00037897001 [Paramecium tetraurelia]CAK69458.1 unnamed protein product [Paramecium tetraurelia]|eukprot:XP_001436855.1 hypothetical protein (macronuclear) [Paramecium tetraurelia strain d4-2]